MEKIEDIKIGERKVGVGHQTYIIAEAGSNFDGDLERAKLLAKYAKEAGADAYKIQNFVAEKIVSDVGFKDLKVAFQSKWDKPVTEVYRAAEFPREWVKEVSDYCEEIGIDFFSSPYDFEAVDMLEKLNVVAHKIGSGEIDNIEFLEHVSRTGKPIVIACGSSTIEDVERAVEAIRNTGNNKIVLLQCVTNYPSPVADANLNAMVTMREKFNVHVGYSDHTTSFAAGGDDPLGGITVPLGSIALGGIMIEKHFTDDRKRKGPDHPYAMEIAEFKLMIDSIRAMEQALGDGVKRVMPSEKDTVVIQRRGVYATVDIKEGENITKDKIELLRPAVGLKPHQLPDILKKKATKDIRKGEPITSEHVQLL